MASNTLTILCNNLPFDDELSARAFLDNFTHHKIGQIVQVLYYKNSAKDDVTMLVAMGVKNASDCGPNGIETQDNLYHNKYYPNGPCGPEFYELLCVDNGGGSGGTKYNTTIHVNGQTYVVANNNDITIGDDEVTDPFIWDSNPFNN